MIERQTLIAVVFFVSACTLLPGALSCLLSPWLGLLITLSGLCVWVTWNPLQNPGFASGMLRVWGAACIAIGSLVHLTLAVRKFID